MRERTCSEPVCYVRFIRVIKITSETIRTHIRDLPLSDNRTDRAERNDTPSQPVMAFGVVSFIHLKTHILRMVRIVIKRDPAAFGRPFGRMGSELRERVIRRHCVCQFPGNFSKLDLTPEFDYCILLSGSL